MLKRAALYFYFGENSYNTTFKQPLRKVGPKQPLRKVGPKQPLRKVGPKQPLRKVGPKQPLRKVGPKQPLYLPLIWSTFFTFVLAQPFLKVVLKVVWKIELIFNL